MQTTVITTQVPLRRKKDTLIAYLFWIFGLH
ncbi:hypothetical protein KIPB_015920, partial [Kipferlia bialata]|eukprot:g15920.t1